MRYALALLFTLLFSITALAEEGNEMASMILDHECHLIEKYNTYNKEDEKLNLINKQAEEGIKLVNPFKYGPAGVIEEYYYNREEYKGRRYLNTFQCENGRLYGLYENGSIAVNGRYANKIYDENGTLVNTANLMFAKYKDEFINAKNNEYIYFDSISDKNAFLMYMHTVYGFRQQEYYDVTWLGNKIGVKKSDIMSVIDHSEEDDIKFNLEIDRLVDKVKSCISDNNTSDHALYAAIGYVLNNEYDWDKSYMCVDILKCMESKKMVCYHFSKITAAILDRLDYNYTYEFGSIDNENHAWLLIKDKNSENYTRFDPTYQKYFTAYGFLDSYTIRGIVYD